jgi:hypothetical protein
MKIDYNEVEKEKTLCKVKELKPISKDEVQVKYDPTGIDFVSMEFAKELSEKHGVKIEYPKAMELGNGKRK